MRRLCQMMGVHPSGYYAWRAEPLSERGKSDRRLVGLIKQSWLESGGVYGYRKITTAFLAANPKRKLEAAVAAVCMMGVAGEIAWTRMQEGDGNATYRNRIIDAIYNMTGEKLEKGAKYELY